MKLKEWITEWLTTYVKPTAKTRTYQRYSEIVYKQIIPKLGEYDLADLTTGVLQRYINELLESGNKRTGGGLSPSSVGTIVFFDFNGCFFAIIYKNRSRTYD